MVSVKGTGCLAWERGNRADMIHEKGDIECNISANGKPVKLLRCRCDAVSGTKTSHYTSSSV